MYDVVMCGRRGARDVSCAFVWPAWYSICFMPFPLARGPGLCSTCFMWFRGASVVLAMLHVDSCGQRGNRDVSYVFEWLLWYSRCFLWFRVASVVPEMFMWFRVASVVLEMLHVVSCGQRGARDVSCGFVWPVWYSRGFMWFRVANVAVDMLHVVPCGQRGCGFVRPVWNTRCCMLFRVACVVSRCFMWTRCLRRNSCCFVWPAWCSRCFICFRDVWPAWYPRYFMLFGFSFSVNHAEVCVIEGKLFLVTTSGGTAVRMMRKGAKRWLTFHLSKRNSTPSSFWAALIGYVDTKCWGSGKMPGAEFPPKAGWDQPPLPGVSPSR